MQDESLTKVRVDKWLWAARFYKTRGLAKQAIEGGKVRLAGQRVKASRDIAIGDVLHIRVSWDEREIEVVALSDKRGPAKIAATLYKESEASLEKRAQRQLERRAMGANAQPDHKPNSRERRHLQRAKRAILFDDD
jgi:ribosome-associated heat shock protein Hsp15